MIYLHKVLPLLASPLFLIIILVLWGSLFRSRRAGLAAIGILIVCSLPVFSNKLISYLEFFRKFNGKPLWEGWVPD